MPTYTNTVTDDENAMVGVADKGIGVWGGSNTSTGTGGMSDRGIGVHGVSKAGPGVQGNSSDGGIGVHGVSKAGPGVQGNSEDGAGVYGGSKTSTGVAAISEKGIGVHAVSNIADGVFGSSEKGRGVVGVADSGAAGVEGDSKSGAGVYGWSETGIGVHGKGGRLGGLFEGNVEISGNLTIQGVSIQLWLERIVKLEQQVTWLLGFGPLPISIRAKLIPRPTNYDGPGQARGGDRLIEISGYGFEPNERVTLKVTRNPENRYDPDPDIQIRAAYPGSLYYTIPVGCGIPGISWQVQAIGDEIGHASNVVSVSC